MAPEPSDPSTVPLRLLPDSADTRRLVELTSHANDLSEASHALALAFEAGDDSPAWMPLTMHAATAYIRPFIHSNVRTRLDHMEHFPGMPSGLAPLHQTVRTYRNTTVAHSQSNLATPMAFGLLDAGGRLSRVFGSTLSHPMPRAIADQFDVLIGAVSEIVEGMTEPVVERLERLWSTASPESVASWPMPTIDASLDVEFSGAQERSVAPAFTTYWRVERTALEQDESADSQP